MVVYRVNWLRAKARFKRWEEERNLVRHEMIWTIEYFKHQQQQWDDRREQIAKEKESAAGLACYAAKQVALWKEFASVGTLRFKGEIVYLKL
jgi:hypothetical protein